jgi:hypothetical protein
MDGKKDEDRNINLRLFLVNLFSEIRIRIQESHMAAEIGQCMLITLVEVFLNRSMGLDLSR